MLYEYFQRHEDIEVELMHTRISHLNFDLGSVQNLKCISSKNSKEQESKSLDRDVKRFLTKMNYILNRQ